MFETRIQNLINQKTEKEQEFLMDVRINQVKKVIDSLSDEELTNLQKSIYHVFDEILQFNKIVKDGIDSGKNVHQILDELRQAYQMSGEDSAYYQEYFHKIMHFFSSECTATADLKSKSTDKTMLVEWQFMKFVETPMLGFKNELLKEIYVEDGIRNQLCVKENKRIEDANRMVELCQSIKDDFLCIEDSSFQDAIQQLNVSKIYHHLILPIMSFQNPSISCEQKRDLDDLLLFCQQSQLRFAEKLQDLNVTIENELAKVSNRKDFHFSKMNDALKFAENNAPSLFLATAEYFSCKNHFMQTYPPAMLRFLYKNVCRERVIYFLNEYKDELARFYKNQTSFELKDICAKTFSKILETTFSSKKAADISDEKRGEFYSYVLKGTEEKTIEWIQEIMREEKLKRIVAEFFTSFTSFQKDEAYSYIQKWNLDNLIESVFKKVKSYQEKYPISSENVDVQDAILLEEEQNARNIQEKEIIDAIFYGDEAYKKSIGSKMRF